MLVALPALFMGMNWSSAALLRNAARHRPPLGRSTDRVIIGSSELSGSSGTLQTKLARQGNSLPG